MDADGRPGIPGSAQADASAERRRPGRHRRSATECARGTLGLSCAPMSPRAAVLAALLAASAGCASAPPSTRPKPGSARAARRPKHRTLHVARPAIQERRSEREPVIEEVPDPEAKRLFEARLEEPALALVPAALPPKVTAIALADTARGEAPGMRPAEEIAAATLPEGKRATMAVTLAPGSCATFIAQGGLGVIEVDLFLVLADRSAGARILAQDRGVGPIAVIGGHGRCYKNPRDTPLAAELHTTVRRGSGVVLVRGYRK